MAKIKVEIYNSKRQYEKKMARMLRKGWSVLNVDIKDESPGLVFAPLLGLASFAKVKMYHVTYQK